ncbi:MAG: amphi-Trp domain-containing protein [Methanothrix sp.]|jgi:amphi-Trp domain-containing protein|uniref:amphi-Trp domain-containing protein n=1 Tax=Methanothrix sp. TaxID=90426 RepID=UPI001BD66C6B|nr:amphi-Trp domain-containing protein [Methanothrix sp.]MBK7387310.1 amphi-Trp domain-containing protein [Methanothrix sp.]HPW73593.1 amphi-Trp domain-containing protein [Methanothrix sp.]
MVRISGRSGRTKGSPSGGDKFEQEIYMTAGEMADMMRGLASEIENRGRVEASYADWTLGVNPNEPLKAEIQFKHDPSRRELEVQLKLKEFP